MSDKATRTYNSELRRAQASQTRQRILDAAQRLFLARGYAGATIPAIAAEAGVAVETVYRSATGKAGLLAAVIRAAVAGGSERADVPVTDRPAIRRVIDEPDPVRQLELYAATQPGIWSRVGPLLRVLDVARDTDTSLVELRQQIVAERRDGLHSFGKLLEERGVLLPGMTGERAGDIIYAVCGWANYDALVTECGWTQRRYRAWVADTLVGSLLPRDTRASQA